MAKVERDSGDKRQRGKLKPVTQDRLDGSGGDFRAQVNVDRWLYALLYNGTAFCYGQGSEYARDFRNFLKGELEADWKAKVITNLERDPGFHKGIRAYIDEMVDEPLQAKAEAFYREMGWNG